MTESPELIDQAESLYDTLLPLMQADSPDVYGRKGKAQAAIVEALALRTPSDGEVVASDAVLIDRNFARIGIDIADAILGNPSVEIMSEREQNTLRGDIQIEAIRVLLLSRKATLARPQGMEVTEPDEMLVAALKGLVLLKDLFDASDRNQADAYYILAKQDGAWGNARSALSALTTERNRP